MNLSLRNLKIHADMSEETNCFSATICRDGKPVGTVRNSGHGGMNLYHWNNAQVGHEIETWANQQPTEFEFEKLDQIVSDLMQKFEEMRQLRRWCKTKTVYRLKGDRKDEWRTIQRKYDTQIKAALEQKYGDQLEMIGNELVLAEQT